MKDKVLIIVEAGVNHNGKLDLALKLCDAAKAAGADAVKFQTFNTEINVLKDCEMAEYQKKNVGETTSHWEMIKKLELTHDEFWRLKRHCDRIGIEFLSTPSETESLAFLMSMGMKKIKISSGEITNLPLLRAVGKLKKEVLLSTGMANMKEIKAAIAILVAAGTPKNKITVLHCTTDYPTKPEEVNILAMLSIRDAFSVKVGYSDHTTGIEASVAAVALGATLIEKHFTLNHSLPGPDHAASLEPGELKGLVVSIRRTETMLGSGEKKPTFSEIKNKSITRKTIVAKRLIKKGEIFSEDNLMVKRPELGISAMQWDTVMGKKAKKDFASDEAVRI